MAPNIEAVLEAYELLRSTPSIREIINSYELLKSLGLKTETWLKIMGSSHNNNNNNGVPPQNPNVESAVVVVESSSQKQREERKEPAVAVVESSSQKQREERKEPAAVVVESSSQKQREERKERKESPVVGVESSSQKQREERKVSVDDVLEMLKIKDEEIAEIELMKKTISLKAEKEMVVPSMSKPKVTIGNLQALVDEEEKRREMAKYEFSLIGKLEINRGEWSYKMNKLKKKLSLLWNIHETQWKLVPLGYGYFTIFVCSMKIKSTILSTGIFFSLNPGTFKLFQWVPNFQATKLEDPPALPIKNPSSS